jgi:1-acyl-sn-glycerol-3-phosphate acyltransferase
MCRHAWNRLVLCVRSTLAGAWLFLSLVVLIPVAGVTLLVDHRQRLHDRFAVLWARGILFIMGMHVSCHGREHIRIDKRYLVTAKHQGFLDIPALIVAMQSRTPLRFLAKKSLFRIPILGWGMWLFGHIPIDRRGAKEAMPGLLRAQQAVRGRWSIVFFPEGTRTYTGGMGPFKKGAFHTAAKARAQVLPVTIAGSWEKLPRQELFAIAQGTIRICIHPPLEAPGESLDQIQTTADECRRLIQNGLSASIHEPRAQKVYALPFTQKESQGSDRFQGVLTAEIPGQMVART